MSELIDSNASRTDYRRCLLANVSVLALCGSVYVSGAARAEDASRPTIWLELGGQLETISGGSDPFAPPFITKHLDAPYNFVSPLKATHDAKHGFGGEGKLTLQPQNSDWTFSASVRYGRSNRNSHLHQQTSTEFRQKTSKYKATNPIFRHLNIVRFDDATVEQNENHMVVDFAAGRDVGLGLFHGESSFSFGVRFAQFQNRSDTSFKSFPDPHYSTKFKPNDPLAHHHSYFATSELKRDFSGIGPSIAWHNFTPLIGHGDAGEVTFDWSANVAALFGRQKTQGHYQTSARYFHGSPIAIPGAPTSHYVHPALVSRSRSVIVPNVGGFAGISARYPNAKVSLGYRADFFFGAMDGGVDARKSTTRGFYGPYATISIGLGG